MRYLVFLLTLPFLLTADPLYAVYSRDLLGATDTLDWSPGWGVPPSSTPISLISAGGITVTASSNGIVGVGKNQGGNNFSLGDYFVSASDPVQRGVLTLSFSVPLSGIGGQVIDEQGGGYTVARLTAYDGVNAVIGQQDFGGWVLGGADGSAPFMGFSANADVIRRLDIEIVRTGQYVMHPSPSINQLSLRTGEGPYVEVVPTPEPSTCAMLAIAAGLFAWRKRRNTALTIRSCRSCARAWPGKNFIRRVRRSRLTK